MVMNEQRRNLNSKNTNNQMHVMYNHIELMYFIKNYLIKTDTYFYLFN